MAKHDVEKAPIVQTTGNHTLPGKPGQRRKTILDARNILTVYDKDPNFEYRWVVDRIEKNRIASLMDRGWELVAREGGVEVGDTRVNEGHPIDSRVTVRSGGELLVLMRIKKEWFEEDRRLYNEDLDAREAGMRRSKNQGEDANGLIGDVQIL